jgi:quercetin dioxygenase-like cupin family protein
MGLGRFADERGLIEDLLAEPIDSVTRIHSVPGAIRGNHIHHETVQWVYVIDGLLLTRVRDADGTERDQVLVPGELAREDPGLPHAWKALTACTVLVFTRGPRSGTGYESDTERLPEDGKLL